MIIKMSEYEGCFSFEMQAETVADAALLARFAANRTVEVRHANADATQDGSFWGHLVIGKAKNSTSRIRKRT